MCRPKQGLLLLDEGPFCRAGLQGWALCAWAEMQSSSGLLPKVRALVSLSQQPLSSHSCTSHYTQGSASTPSFDMIRSWWVLVLWGAQGEVSSGLEGLCAAGTAQELELHCPRGNVFKDVPSLFLWNVMPHFKAACSSHGNVFSQVLIRSCMSSCRESISTKRGISSVLFLGVYFVSPKEEIALVV